jgi:hypothetical protein
MLNDHQRQLPAQPTSSARPQLGVTATRMPAVMDVVVPPPVLLAHAFGCCHTRPPRPVDPDLEIIPIKIG